MDCLEAKLVTHPQGGPEGVCPAGGGGEESGPVGVGVNQVQRGR